MLYSIAFDVKSARLPALGTLTLSASGETDIVIDLAAVTGVCLGKPFTTNVFFHWTFLLTGNLYIRATDRSGEYRRTDIAHFGFEQTIALFANAQGWAGVFLIGMDLTTGLVTAVYTGGNFDMTWSTAGGRALCGFAADQTGADTYVGTVVPMFVVKPIRRAVSLPTRKMRERGAISAVRADSGGGSSLGRYVTAQRIKFAQQFESPAIVERELAVSTHPSAFEDIFDQAASGLPFIVVDGGFGYGSTAQCLSLTSDAEFAPEGRSANKMDVSALSIALDCYVEGKISAT